jgi:uncharacterized membrane protein YdjX (TVP38/TMEM64 family)
MTETREESSLDVPPPAPAEAGRKTAVIRLGLLFLLIVALVVVAKFTPVLDWLTAENIDAMRASLGWWTIPVYIVVSGLLVALWMPGSVVLVVGTVAFGTMAAMPINYIAAVLGAVWGFAIARNVAGDAVDRILAPRWPGYRRYRALLERRGMETLLYMRILPTPFTAVSYLAGVSPLTAWQHALATAIGILPGSFALTFLSGTLIDSIKAGDYLLWMKPQFWLALAVFIPTLLLPRLASYGRRRWGWFGGEVLPQAPSEDTDPEQPNT